MSTRYSVWFGGAVGAMLLGAIVVSCGGTGGGGGQKGNPEEQFVLNGNNRGQIILNVSPIEVDANKSDRIGLVAQLIDLNGNPVAGVPITFSSDVDDIRFIPGITDPDTGSDLGLGQAVTDANGNADVIAVAGSQPTSTGAIIGTAAIFAEPPFSFGLRAQVQVTLLDIGFLDADSLTVIPSEFNLVEPGPGARIFFNIIGGTPPYILKNEASGLGTATLSQHCAPGCTENGGVLCVGSPCLADSDCNLDASPLPAGVCIGPIKRCLASCAGTNCGGSRCQVDADCNDGSAAPANVCQDSGQSIVYITGEADVTFSPGGDDNSATHGFIVEDSGGDALTVTVNASFICGNGRAVGTEQCDGGDLRDNTCQSRGFATGTLLCSNMCQFDTARCTDDTGGGGGGGVATATPVVATPTPGAPTVTATPGAPTATATPAAPTATATPAAPTPTATMTAGAPTPTPTSTP